MIKYRIYGDNKTSKLAAQYTLNTALLEILKMFAPFVPHITEEIYHNIFKKTEKTESIHLASFSEHQKIDAEAIKLGKLATKIISEIRQYKQKRNFSMGQEIDTYKLKSKPADWKKIEDIIKGTMRIKNLD